VSSTPATTPAADAAGGSTPASLQSFLQALIQNLGVESSLSSASPQPGALVQATA
jgi:hypothetical protein